MFFSILIVAVVVALIWAQKRIAKVPAAQRNATITTWVLIGAAVVTVGLVLTGRAPWVMGVLAALLAVAGRVICPSSRNFLGSRINSMTVVTNILVPVRAQRLVWG